MSLQNIPLICLWCIVEAALLNNISSVMHKTLQMTLLYQPALIVLNMLFPLQTTVEGKEGNVEGSSKQKSVEKQIEEYQQTFTSLLDAVTSAGWMA